MLDKDSQSILDAFRKNTIEVDNLDPKKESRQLIPPTLSPGLDNVGDSKPWTSS